MKKRIAAAVLWFYAGWFVGSALAFVAGLSPALGPIVAIAAAGVIAVDPRHRIWVRRAVSRGGAMLPSTQRLHPA